MSGLQNEMTLEASQARLAELEQATMQVLEERIVLQSTHLTSEQHTQRETSKRSSGLNVSKKKQSRRGLLRHGFGVVVAVLGAGDLMHIGSMSALAHSRHHRPHVSVHPNDNPAVFTSSNPGVPAVEADGIYGTDGIDATSDSLNGGGSVGVAVNAAGTNGSDGIDSYCDGVNGANAIFSHNETGTAIYGESNGSGNGVEGHIINGSGFGIAGYDDDGTNVNNAGISGISTGLGSGVFGTSVSGVGVSARSTSSSGVSGSSASGIGVLGTTQHGYAGVQGVGTGAKNGVYGVTDSKADSGVYGQNTGAGDGISGYSTSGTGASGVSGNGTGVFAQSAKGDAIHAVGSGSGKSALFAEGKGGYGIYATSTSGIGVAAINSSGVALQVQGHLLVQGNAVGQATLATGKTSVVVTTSAATTSSNILLTSLNKYTGTVWVTRASGSFTINASVAQTGNVVFTYLIIN